MKCISLVAILLLMFPCYLFAQQLSLTADYTKLNQLHTEYANKYSAELLQAENYARLNNLPLTQNFENGSQIQIHGFRNGRAMYYTTDNLNSAKTDGTIKVWPGGISGLSLTGNGITVRIWDGGAILTTHQEITGRASMGAGQTSSLSSHATHVSGTIAASGVDADAKGHAYQASVIGFDWDYDVSEMTTEAAAGMLMSNHSYGYIAGWYYNAFSGMWEWWGDGAISTSEDYIFGNYLDESRDADMMLNAAPYYLPVISAANDRDDDVPAGATYKLIYDGSTHTADGTEPNPDGEYDCIPGGLQTAKNVLTVGAVNDIVAGYSVPSDISVTYYSSFGPCDDGRIKPDIVANGSSLKSCVASATNAYAFFSGTSMAAPSVTGSLALLQQHYNNVHSSYMLASTLKALVIHTADQPNSVFGPTYAHGWGLLNTANAADVITASDTDMLRMQERTLNDGTSQTFELYSDGMQPVKITIAWNDPAGTVPAPAVDPSTKMLVNDLDMILTRNSDATNFYPYKLDRLNPANVATTGDNEVDNVEVVYILTPEAGYYTLTINHKSTLSGGAQVFSMISSGLQCQDKSSTVNATIDEGTSYTLPDGIIVSSAGTYTSTLPTWLGCDSVITTNITVNPVCNIPTGIFVNSITATSARVNWSYASFAVKYQVWYRVVGSSTWTKKTTSSLNKKLTGLAPSSTYEYKIKTICAAIQSGFSAVQTFTTNSLREGEVLSENESDELIIYPNPAKHEFHINFENEQEENAVLNIFTVTGDLIYTKTFSVTDAIMKFLVPEIKPQFLLIEIILDDEIKTCGLIIE